MKPQNLMLLLAILMFNNLMYSQFSLSVDYNVKTNSATKVAKIAKKHISITNHISYSNSNSKNYLESFVGIKNEAYKMSSINRLVINAMNKTYDWTKYYMTRNRTWHSPYGVNSFTEAILRGTLNAVIKKNI